MTKDQFLLDLKELVSVDCGSHYINGINQIADIVCRYFKEMDSHWYETRLNINSECGPILYFSNKKTDDKYDVTFLCHLDTAYETGICKAHPPYQDGNKYYGPGVADMKSGYLSVIYALKHLDQKTLDQLAICVCFTPDEEIGAKYSYSYIEALADRSERVFVPEAAHPNGDLITSRKGKSQIQIDFLAPIAQKDHNKTSTAIILLGQWIEKIQQLSTNKNACQLKISHIKNNHYPSTDTTEITLILRFSDNDAGDRLIAKLQSLAKSTATQDTQIIVSRLTGRPAFSANPSSQKTIDLIKAAAEEINIDIGFSKGTSATDANIASSRGVVTVDGFGPCGGGYHDINEEFILVSTITPRIELLQRTLKKIAELT